MAASGSTAAGKKFRQTGASADAQNRFAVATGNGCIGATSGTGGGGEAPICHAVSKQRDLVGRRLNLPTFVATPTNSSFWTTQFLRSALGNSSQSVVSGVLDQAGLIAEADGLFSMNLMSGRLPGS